MTQEGQVLQKEVKSFTPLYQDSPVIETSHTVEEKLTKDAQYRYLDLPDHELQQVRAILKGWLPMDKLPKLKARIVRVFISSTFTDMTNERDTIIKHAYPLLRAYCRERYGLEYQAVDMRWGVQTGARDDHSTTDLCMEEILNSQQHSVGPNFVAFLGQKYGYIDLPQQLPYDHFEPIRAVIKAEMTDDDIDFLDLWYKKDSNADPTAYVLQPLSTVLGEDTTSWHEAEPRLRSLLSFGADKAVEEAKIPVSVVTNLKASVTEQELDQGVFNTTSQQYINSNVLCFMRDIENIHDHMDRSQVSRFIDLLPKSIQVDQEKNEANKMLRKKLNARVQASNVIEYKIKWSDPKGVDAQVHEEYLMELKNAFYNKMREMVDHNMARQATQVKDELYEEVLQQWDLAKMRCENFLGRTDILEQVAGYILNETDQPLVIHGLSGYGKTSIIAKAASEVITYLQKDGLQVQPCVVLRFCGTSPASSNLRQLLHSLSHQLAFVTDKYRYQIPNDFKLLKAHFKDMLQKGNFTGMVVIFLDAINQLGPEDNAHKLDWLPSKIAKNVKIIVSAISGDNNVYQKLQSKITNPQYYIEVKEMSPVQCGEIINSSLQKQGRMINFNQWRLVREVFNKCALPLFAKLTFEEVMRWKSYMNVPTDALANSVSACIQRLFDRLEEKHGQVMVSHALAYISASQGGISEAEMEDVLSLDDKVLNSVFTFWEPPVRRIPPILFPRIKHDILGYLVERECDETTVMYWYHQQFIEATQQRYLSNEEILQDVHVNLAEYFLGKWSEMIKKPYLYTQGLAQRLRLKVKDLASSAVRYVPAQPLIFQTYNTTERFNFRKLNQMPYHLANAKKIEDLNKYVYFNYDFLYTKLRACSVQRLLSDFSLVENREVSLVADALRMSEAALAADPNVLGIEISGRLMPHYHNYDNIRSLIRQCDINALHKCPVIPNWQVFTSPGGPLQYVCEADASLNSEIDVSLVQNEDAVLLTAKPFSGTKMRVWDITQGEPQPDMVLPSGSKSYPTPDGVYINLFKANKSLQTFRMDSGELYSEVNIPYGTLHQVKTSNKYVAFTYEQTHGPVIIDIDAHVLMHRFQYQAKAVAISQDQQYLVTNKGKCLAIHSIPMMERNCVVECAHAPEKILYSADHRVFYVQDAGHELKCVRVNLVQRRAKASGILRDIEMKDFKLSHSEKLILVRASRCLFLFDATKEKLIHRITSMPPGVFIERLSTFKEAGFTPNDELVIAARHIYLGVWSVKTGQPIRLLQSSVSPILSLYTSDIVNRAITLLQDHSIQVWNLSNLDADVQHLNTIIRGSIKSMSSSLHGDKVICCGKDHAEGRVLDLNTNECQWTLEHTDEIGRHLDDVIMSPCSNYAVTRLENSDYPDYLDPWPELKEDKLWNLKTGEQEQMVTNNRHVVFSPNDDKVVFFICKAYSTRDWSIISYDLIVQVLSGEHSGETYFMGLPDGDTVGKPVITESGQFLAFILQTNDDKRNQLIVYSFEKFWRGLKYLNLDDMWNGFDSEDNMIDLQLFNSDNILVTYGHNVNNFEHSKNGFLDRNKHIHKASFVYDVRNDNIMRKMDKFLLPNSSVDKMMLSDQRSYILDQHGQLLSIMDNEHVNTLDINPNKVLPNCICLIQDGKYVAMLSANRRELLIERASDGVNKARVFLHGVADHIHVAQNDRTVLIGCRDGRVMSFTVVLELSDHMQEVVNLLPSRNNTSIKTTHEEKTDSFEIQRSKTLPVKRNGIFINGTSKFDGTKDDIIDSGVFSLNGTSITLKSDIKRIQNTHNLQKRLSTITRERISDQKRKQATFRLVGHAVLLTQELNRVKQSSACVLQ